MMGNVYFTGLSSKNRELIPMLDNIKNIKKHIKGSHYKRPEATAENFFVIGSFTSRNWQPQIENRVAGPVAL